MHGGDWGHTGNAREGDTVLATVIGDLSRQAKTVTLSTVPSSELTVSVWGLPAPRSLPSLWPRADRLTLPLLSRFTEWKVCDRRPQGNESLGGSKGLQNILSEELTAFGLHTDNTRTTWGFLPSWSSGWTSRPPCERRGAPQLQRVHVTHSNARAARRKSKELES